MSDLKAHIQHDEMDDKLHIAHAQDVAPIIESNRKAFNASEKHDKYSDWNRVASIPAVVVMEWMKEGINVMAPTYEDQKKIKKKLNSPEYAYLRTRKGRL
jgi:hypothetical protein